MPPLSLDGSLGIDELVRADFRDFARQTVLVVGDLILDHYIWGQADRITPEAPVPVVRRDEETWALGGAANVAHNVVALGGRARLVGVVGDDDAGRRFGALLRDAGISPAGVVRDVSRPTTVKTRVVCMGQQLLRIDHESTAALADSAVVRLTAAVKKAVRGCGAVVVSDYAKGALTDAVIQTVVSIAHAVGVPVLVDPKGRDYRKYRGTDILKPNRHEMAVVSGSEVATEDDVCRAGRRLIRQCGLQALIVSRGAEGFSLVRPRGRVATVAARAREVYDVTGAGDTFLATLALGLSVGLALLEAAKLANEAAGVAVGRVGMATVSREDLKAVAGGRAAEAKVRSGDDLARVLSSLRSRGRRIVFTNGCFDLLHAGHIRFLEAARRLGDVLVVGLNTDRSVREVKGRGRPILGEEERAVVLSSLPVVDYVVFFDEPTPERLLEALRPDVLAKGRNVAPEDVVGREIVERYGGRIVRLPVMGNFSTSDLIGSIVGKFEKKA